MKSELIFILLLFTTGIHAQKWTWLEAELSFPRSCLSSTVLDDTVFFSGGMLEEVGTFYNVIDYYDVGENQWTAEVLPTPGRGFTSSVAAGGRVFIAGGDDWNGGTTYSLIDVYYKDQGVWAEDNLSDSRIFIGAIAHENRVFFAGGLNWFTNTYYNVIDIYNTETETWSTEDLSEPKCLIGVAAVGGKVFFAGGWKGINEVSSLVEIYDINDDEWTVEYLQVPRAYIAAIAYDEKVYFAGGGEPPTSTSTIIEIYNVTNEEWETPITLQYPRIVNVLKVHDALVFAGQYDYIDLGSGSVGPANGIVDVYYPETGEWESVPDLDPARSQYAYTSYKNRAYYAGGHLNNSTSNKVNILEYDTLWTDNSEEKTQDITFQVSPNPFSSKITMDYTLLELGKINITLFNHLGEKVKDMGTIYHSASKHQWIIDGSDLPSGMYYCVLKTGTRMKTAKMIKSH